MRPVITAFAQSPDKGRGLARDMRVRWALEEVGQAYEVRLVTFAGMKAAEHRALHPFGQIPTYEEDGLVLFESGAIVLHLAQTRPGLLPEEPRARARAAAWMFAAVNTVEPPILERANAVLLEGNEPWQSERLPRVEERVVVRLRDLAARLGRNEWLDGGFSAGDLLMVHALRRLEGSGLLEDVPGLMAYLERAEARPAYRRAFAAQKAVAERKTDD